MGIHSKKQFAVFIVAGAILLLLISILPSMGNIHGEHIGIGIDSSPPVTSIEYSSPFLGIDGKNWINMNTTVYVNATDESGVKYLHYEIWKDADGNGTFETLVRSSTVWNNDVNDSDPSANISTNFVISSSCHHKVEAYGVDIFGNVESYGDAPLREQWNYSLQSHVTHWANLKKLNFGSSPAIADLFNSTPEKEIVCGSDEVNNFYPEINDTASGLWRCWAYNGSILWAKNTETDEARSSPAICDINGDGKLEIAAGTTSGWNVEVMENNGSFLWTFPAKRYILGTFCWHSSPALVDFIDNNPDLDGLELVIGNNPYHNVWCFDGDNSDGVDDGITLSRKPDGSSPYFPWSHGDIGVEGKDWDVLWVFNNSQPIIASPAVGDIDDDGFKDVVIGSLDGSVYAINGSNGQLKWKYTTGAAVYSSAAIANLDWDSQPEIVVGSNDSYLYCIDGKTGQKQWRYKTGGAIYSSPAIGDVDGDGQLDIVVGSLDGNVYCLDSLGHFKWKYTTGGAIYSSPSLARDGSLYSSEWPMFRHDCARTGFYGSSKLGQIGQKLNVFIGSDDGYLYKLDGENGSLISKFLTNGPVHTSPSIADIDGDGMLEVLFYDWGKEWGNRDTFWCLEEPGIPVTSLVNVDNIPPVTAKDVGGKGDIVRNITDETPIWLNGTDSGNCSVGIKNLHYEVWWDSNGDSNVDTKVADETVWDNGTGDINSAGGIISVKFTMSHYGMNEIRWFSTDLLGNRETEHYQEHMVVVTAPNLVVTKVDTPDPVNSGNILTYNINVTNNGNEDATGVVVRDDYDEGNLFMNGADLTSVNSVYSSVGPSLQVTLTVFDIIVPLLMTDFTLAVTVYTT